MKPVWIIGPIALLGSFLITLWLTSPEAPQGTGASMLASASVSNQAMLHAAARGAGLQTPGSVRGNVEEITPLGGGRARISGWAAEITGRGTPLTVLAFQDGKNVFRGETRGKRPDVTTALSLAEATASNVVFKGELQCMSGHQLIIVAVSPSNEYLALNPQTCP